MQLVQEHLIQLLCCYLVSDFLGEGPCWLFQVIRFSGLLTRSVCIQASCACHWMILKAASEFSNSGLVVAWLGLESLLFLQVSLGLELRGSFQYPFSHQNGGKAPRRLLWARLLRYIAGLLLPEHCSSLQPALWWVARVVQWLSI